MANNSIFSWDLFYTAPIVGIMRGISMHDIKFIAHAYIEGGLSTLEITMNTEGVGSIIKMLRKEFPKLNIGAGTVCSLTDLDTALDAGAQFIVTPVLNEAVINRSVALGIPIFPGAYSPTEIYKAWEMGASVVKVFPANQLGPGYIKDVLAPLNSIKLLPTGGVTIDNIGYYIQAGAIGVGMGGSLFDKRLIAEKNEKELTAHFKKIREKIELYTK